MAGEIAVTVTGSITEPTLRFADSGKPFVRFNIASNPRVKDGDNWVDGEPTWFSVTAFGTMAENIAESLNKGDRVVVSGSFKTRTWKDDQGNDRSGLDLVADEVAPSLRWATAQITKAPGGGRGGNAAAQSNVQRSRTAQPQGDPWATPGSDEPPF